MSSDLAYSSFIRATSSWSENRSESRAGPASGGGTDAPGLATVIASPHSSSVSATRSSRFGWRRRARISRASASAPAYASKYPHSRVIARSVVAQRSG